MQKPRLTCPSVWCKRVLLSRAQVEESYSQGLRRWAGYQRFLLQMDDGKSAKPFRQMLESMILDAERQADDIDNMVKKVGDTDDGVIGRISTYETHIFKPRRDKLLRKAADRKLSLVVPVTPVSPEPLAPHVASDIATEIFTGHDNNQIFENYTLQTTKSSFEISPETERNPEDFKAVLDDWVALFQERLYYLADGLTEFAESVAACQTKREKDVSRKTFEQAAMESAFNDLLPQWKNNLETQIREVILTRDSPDRLYQAESKTRPGSREQKEYIWNTGETDSPDGEWNEFDTVMRTSPCVGRKPHHNPSVWRTYPTSVANFEVLPLNKREFTRWSDMGTSSAYMEKKTDVDVLVKCLNCVKEDMTSLTLPKPPRLECKNSSGSNLTERGKQKGILSENPVSVLPDIIRMPRPFANSFPTRNHIRILPKVTIKPEFQAEEKKESTSKQNRQAQKCGTVAENDLSRLLPKFHKGLEKIYLPKLPMGKSGLSRSTVMTPAVKRARRLPPLNKRSVVTSTCNNNVTKSGDLVPSTCGLPLQPSNKRHI